MRICVDMGHTPASPGAAGFIDELNEDRRVGHALMAKLRERGFDVVNSTPPGWVAYPDEVSERALAANGSGADLFCSVHFNATAGATGTECLYWYTDSLGLQYAEQVSANVAACLGLRDRGPKANGWVGVLRETAMTSILVEVCFVDTEGDADAYRRVGPEAVADAIVRGIEAIAGAQRPQGPRRAIQYGVNLTDAQRFSIEPDGAYVRIRAYDGTYLDAWEGSTKPMANGRPVAMVDGNGTDAQLWALGEGENGALVIRSKLDDRFVVEDAGGSLAHGYVQLYREQSGTADRFAQQWYRIPAYDGRGCWLVNAKSLMALDCNPHGIVY